VFFISIRKPWHRTCCNYCSIGNGDYENNEITDTYTTEAFERKMKFIAKLLSKRGVEAPLFAIQARNRLFSKRFLWPNAIGQSLSPSLNKKNIVSHTQEKNDKLNKEQNASIMELLAKRLNVTPPSRRQIVSRRFITYLDAGGDAGATMIRFLQEALMSLQYLSEVKR